VNQLNTHTDNSTVNINVQCPNHVDKGDAKNAWCVLSVLRSAGASGGWLYLPELNLAFEMDHCSMLIFKAYKWEHVNTIIQCESAGDARIALVGYVQQKMLN
jgi:hypothetical protein